VTDPAAGSVNPESAAAAREYPARPIVGVGGVVVIDGRVLLIKRRFEPLAGRWSLPGGTLEVGETLAEGLAREMKEETGLDVDVGPVVDVFDRITRDSDGRTRFHYVLVDYLCHPLGGEPVAGSDVSEVALVEIDDLGRYDLTPKTIEVITRALDLSKAVGSDSTESGTGRV
jgi:ADP-ribose pyrophosphatase YjhB (NUDIX family)